MNKRSETLNFGAWSEESIFDSSFLNHENKKETINDFQIESFGGNRDSQTTVSNAFVRPPKFTKVKNEHNYLDCKSKIFDICKIEDNKEGKDKLKSPIPTNDLLKKDYKQILRRPQSLDQDTNSLLTSNCFDDSFVRWGNEQDCVLYKLILDYW